MTDINIREYNKNRLRETLSDIIEDELNRKNIWYTPKRLSRFTEDVMDKISIYIQHTYIKP